MRTGFTKAVLFLIAVIAHTLGEFGIDKHKKPMPGERIKVL